MGGPQGTTTPLHHSLSPVPSVPLSPLSLHLSVLSFSPPFLLAPLFALPPPFPYRPSSPFTFCVPHIPPIPPPARPSFAYYFPPHVQRLATRPYRSDLITTETLNAKSQSTHKLLATLTSLFPSLFTLTAFNVERPTATRALGTEPAVAPPGRRH